MEDSVPLNRTDLRPDDRSYLDELKRAQERQQAAHAEVMKTIADVDAERARASEQHMNRVRAASAPVPADLVVNQPIPAPSIQAPTPNASLSILKAKPFIDSDIELPHSEEKFAPDWPKMKTIISKLDGVWVVKRYEFIAAVPLILGFFGKGDWEAPVDAEKETFEVIVKGGRVFRSDPE